MIVRDYGFASYLILVGYKYEYQDNVLMFNISEEDFLIQSKVYKRNYQKKDKILRQLLKTINKSKSKN